MKLTINSSDNLEISTEDTVLTVYKSSMKNLSEKLKVIANKDIISCKMEVDDFYSLYKYESVIKTAPMVIEICDLEDDEFLTISDIEAKMIIKFIGQQS